MTLAIPPLGGIVHIENTEPKISTMFLSDVTVIDHAYIDDQGNMIGGSYHPTFIVGGSPDPTEKVVVDFSAVKKQIKSHIDRHIPNIYNNGFDHKLWLIEGLSNYQLFSGEGVTGRQVLVETPTMRLTLPADAVRVISGDQAPCIIDGNRGPDVNSLNVVLAKYVEDHLNALHPGVNISVTCQLSERTHLPAGDPSSQAVFRYAHGLKDSTSYGCKNIAHGHCSFIQATVTDQRSKPDADHVINTIAREFDRVIFVRGDNIIDLSETAQDESIAIQYTTDRGYTRMGVKRTSKQRIVVLKTETTIEFIAQTIADLYHQQLTVAGIDQIYVSEGLSKGATVNIRNSHENGINTQSAN